ncbi:MAG: P-loop NTPase fold protein [Candidatus Gracilibacteria bacterium]|nr:P-loop NTPase fold protein [Candidatus Gracilibacteria bacterium]
MNNIYYSILIGTLYLSLYLMYIYLLHNKGSIDTYNNIILIYNYFAHGNMYELYIFLLGFLGLFLGLKIIFNFNILLRLLTKNINGLFLLLYWILPIKYLIIIQKDSDIINIIGILVGFLFVYLSVSFVIYSNSLLFGKNNRHSSDFDTPVKSKEEDKLDFSMQVKNLCEKIIGIENNLSFVLSIESSWGNGKTSFINMIKERLQSKDNFDKFYIIDVNSWDINKNNNILEFIYKLILDSISKDRDITKLKKSIFKYIALLNGLTFKRETFNYKINLEEDSGFELEKTKIIAELNKIDKKILIIIDDLDRIKFEHFLEILRIINTSRDFPNLVFMLSFDYENLNKFDVELKDRFITIDAKDGFISEEINNTRIIKYLEKIIDIKYLLTVDLEIVRDLFINKLTNVFRNHYKENINYRESIKENINELYNNYNFRIYGNYLSNLRSIKKIIQTININLNLNSEFPGVFDKIHLIEYIKVVLIYLYHPKLFNDIYTETSLNNYYSTSLFLNNQSDFYSNQKLDNKIGSARKKYLFNKSLIDKEIIDDLFFSDSITRYSINDDISIRKNNENIKRIIALITNNALILNQIRSEIEVDTGYNKFITDKNLYDFLEGFDYRLNEYGINYLFNKLNLNISVLEIQDLIFLYKAKDYSLYISEEFIKLFFNKIKEDKELIEKYILEKENIFIDIFNKKVEIKNIFLILEFRSYFKDNKEYEVIIPSINKNVKNTLEEKIFFKGTEFNIIKELYENANNRYGEYFIYIIYQLSIDIGINNFKEYVMNLLLYGEQEHIIFFKTKILKYYEDLQSSGKEKLQELFPIEYIKSLGNK